MTYDYPDDGKFHTRYSELQSCSSIKAAMAVAKKRLGITERIENDILRFGQLRHEMWEEEAKQTDKTPECFKEALGLQWDVLEAENHRASEIFENVVIHFTTDVITTTPALIDYKTATEMRKAHYKQYYGSQYQMPVYALLLRPHGIHIKDAHYLLECWDRERKNLKGYLYVHKPIRLREMADARNWLQQRVSNLIQAENLVRKEFALEK